MCTAYRKRHITTTGNKKRPVYVDSVTMPDVNQPLMDASVIDNVDKVGVERIHRTLEAGQNTNWRHGHVRVRLYNTLLGTSFKHCVTYFAEYD